MEKLIKEDEFMKKFKPYLMWSDTGRHHFGCRDYPHYFAQLANHHHLRFQLHFFEPYHGYNICDAVAAQAKQAIRKQQGNKEEIISTTSHITDIINTITHHEGYVAPSESKDNYASSEVRGISKMRMFVHNATNLFGFRDPQPVLELGLCVAPKSFPQSYEYQTYRIKKVP